ncbi:MAG: ZIP family metal transporter, partial [Desulfocucumaceae bacterium]
FSILFKYTGIRGVFVLSGQEIVIAFLSGMATGFGGLLAALSGRIGSGLPVLLGLSSGIGFTVVFFELLPESVHTGSWTLAALGLLSGIAFGLGADKVFTNSNTGSAYSFYPGRRKNLLRSGYFFALGVAMHNLPEGMAIGAGLEARTDLGLLLALAIGLHNLPEGMALSGLLIMGGGRPFFAVATAAAAGLVLPGGTVLAGIWLSAEPGMLAYIMALGAGALLYIIFYELIPQSLRMHPARAGMGILAGGCLSLLLMLVSV